MMYFIAKSRINGVEKRYMSNKDGTKAIKIIDHVIHIVRWESSKHE